MASFNNSPLVLDALDTTRPSKGFARATRNQKTTQYFMLLFSLEFLYCAGRTLRNLLKDEEIASIANVDLEKMTITVFETYE
jgi:hypothetical protein